MTTSPLKVDSEQQKFEAACRDGLLHGGLAKFDGGRYVSSLTDSVWRGWQASRAAIVVELPDYIGADTYQSAGYNEALDECDNAIRAAGITVKGDSDG